MKPTIDTPWKRVLLLLLVAAFTLGAAAQADDEEVKRKVVISDSGHGFLGVELTSLTPELREHFGVPKEVGVMIGVIEEDSPAAAAGLRVGDIITRIDDEEIRSASRLVRTVHHKQKGDVVAIEYWRDGRADTLSATLDERQRLVYDLGKHFEWTGDLDELIELHDLDEVMELGDLGLEISQETLESVTETLRELLENRDWEVYLKDLENIELEGLEERMEEVKERLKELELQLEQGIEHDDDL
ncbi:MAG: PDZ domain-containing protein [bacterium]|nr:PDZ domain-containing protein [bacterium]